MITLLLDHLWQSTAFALVIVALAFLLKNNAAQWRYGLWFAASIKFLIPFSLLVGVGTHVIQPVVPDMMAAVSVMAVQQVAQPFSASDPVLAFHETDIDWLPLVGAAWSVGFGFILLAAFRHWLRMGKVLRHARALSFHAPLPVMESKSCQEPGLVGIWRPVLLLPQGISARLSEREMAAVLAHEITHWRRRDNLTASVHLLVQALFWFHPLVWWLGARLMQERERACDEYVVEAGNDPQIYAEGILKVCKFYLQSPPAFAAGLSGADLRKRVEMIMADRRAAPLSAAKKALLFIAALSTIATPVAAGLTSSPGAPNQADIEKRYAEQARTRTEIAFDPRAFDRYVGAYQGDTLITVSREGAHFFTARTLGVNATRMTPRPKIEIFAESPDKFFARDIVAQYSFIADASGAVTALVFHQSGVERVFKKISATQAQIIAAAMTDRIRHNQAAPGTQAALARYIVALQSGKPDYRNMAPGISARTPPGARGARKRMESFGAFKSLRFKGVAPDGMDIYDAAFANGHTEWWIAPLSREGKVVWVGFNPSLQPDTI
jgi:beta-lactamase regulating signal transducer with metallopeptidase domain